MGFILSLLLVALLTTGCASYPNADCTRHTKEHQVAHQDITYSKKIFNNSSRY